MPWLINGLADGALIAVLALAFMLVYSTTGIFYVALGAVYCLPPLLARTLLDAGIAWPMAFVAGALAAALASTAMEATMHWPLERRASPAAHVVCSLGLSIVLTQLMVMIWGNELQILSVAPPDVSTIFGMRIAIRQLEALGTAAILFLVLGLWLSHGRGAAPIRAMSANRVELSLTGTNVRALRLAVFGLAGLIASLPAYLRAFDNGFDTTSGLSAVVLAFTALVIGGRDSVWGALLGGFAVGVLRSAVVWFGASRLQEPITFLLFAAFLLFWPTGLLGRRVRLEAER